jgi:hypothetical protein
MMSLFVRRAGCTHRKHPHGCSDEAGARICRNVQRLAPRWFIVNDAHAASVGPILLNPRQTISVMRGPMTCNEILHARQVRAPLEGIELPRTSAMPAPMQVAILEIVPRLKALRFADTELEFAYACCYPETTNFG